MSKQRKEISLKAYFDALLYERDKRYMQRYEAQVALIAAAQAAMKEAITKAEVATERRFESVNEFRETLSDQTKLFIARTEFNGLRDVVTEQMGELAARLDRSDGRLTGLNAGWTIGLGIFGLLQIVATLYILFERGK